LLLGKSKESQREALYELDEAEAPKTGKLPNAEFYLRHDKGQPVTAW